MRECQRGYAIVQIFPRGQGESDLGRRVRMYKLTTKGRAQLTEERSRWERLTQAMAAMMMTIKIRPERGAREEASVGGTVHRLSRGSPTQAPHSNCSAAIASMTRSLNCW